MPLPRRARAEILCVGSELLSGKVNTHAAYLSLALRAAGVAPERESTMIDDEGEIRDAVTAAVARADIVLVCGGLGPTFDDITREGVAAALGRRLRYEPELWERIQKRYRRFKMRVPSNNKRQAWIVDGAAVLDNPRGSAPGQWITLENGTVVVLMPGPFRELDPMFRGAVLPALKKRFCRGSGTAARVLRLYGVSESEADRRLEPILYKKGKGLEATILADLGRVSLHLTANAASTAAARKRLRSIENAVRKEFGIRLYGIDEETLESALGKRLKARRWKAAVAESCTGGLLGQRLSETPGSSAYFLGGIIAYADTVKTAALGVPRALLRKHGAVSDACVRAMAQGVRTATGADVGIAITGVAGPGGGTPEKPVGLVHVAVVSPSRARAARILLPGTRDQVRSRAASAAAALALSVLS